ncbi:hypothetical protein C7S15_7483 [Burkholderia cepacia]|nr:hypothetical protein [Burkholderia cepacia]
MLPYLGIDEGWGACGAEIAAWRIAAIVPAAFHPPRHDVAIP